MKHCASCHGEDGKLGSSGAKDLSETSLSDKALFSIISKGKKSMPAMVNLFKDSSEISLVISHLKTLKK